MEIQLKFGIQFNIKLKKHWMYLSPGNRQIQFIRSTECNNSGRIIISKKTKGKLLELSVSPGLPHIGNDVYDVNIENHIIHISYKEGKMKMKVEIFP